MSEQLLTRTTASDPKCPKGIIQWQHGSYEKHADGSLTLKPIKVDGRQLYSDPCEYKTSVYTRYNATEKFKVRHDALVSAHITKQPRFILTSSTAIRIRRLRRLRQNPAHHALQGRRRPHDAPIPRHVDTQDAPHNDAQPPRHANRRSQKFQARRTTFEPRNLVQANTRRRQG
jgi:hypothetical protein